MGRLIQNYSASEKMPTLVFLSHVGSIDETMNFTFTDGSIRYFERIIKNAFDYTLVDNVGTGKIRVSYNRPNLNITEYSNGAKTLKAGDSIYIEDEVWNIKILFLESSIIELVLKSDKNN